MDTLPAAWQSLQVHCHLTRPAAQGYGFVSSTAYCMNQLLLLALPVKKILEHMMLNMWKVMYDLPKGLYSWLFYSTAYMNQTGPQQMYPQAVKYHTA